MGPLVVALAVTVGIFWLALRSSGGGVGQTADRTGNVNAWMEWRLPNGTNLRAPQYGAESRMIRYLQDGSKGASKDRWFDLDELRFDAAAPDVRGASREQLHNIAGILIAYPNVTARLAACATESLEKPQFSRDRAEHMRTDLIAMGVAPGRLKVEDCNGAISARDAAAAQNSTRIFLRVTQ
ncbi:MAG TPA: hypothetical protein VG675_07565 [Bryobacteraceae bacterium]|nr:hypothetical protein [Bryobacteraceae bacterium]